MQFILSIIVGNSEKHRIRLNGQKFDRKDAHDDRQRCPDRTECDEYKKVQDVVDALRAAQVNHKR
jgi:hypothetical protein